MSQGVILKHTLPTSQLLSNNWVAYCSNDWTVAFRYFFWLGSFPKRKQQQNRHSPHRPLSPTAHCHPPPVATHHPLSPTTHCHPSPSVTHLLLWQSILIFPILYGLLELFYILYYNSIELYLSWSSNKSYPCHNLFHLQPFQTSFWTSHCYLLIYLCFIFVQPCLFPICIFHLTPWRLLPHDLLFCLNLSLVSFVFIHMSYPLVRYTDPDPYRDLTS